MGSGPDIRLLAVDDDPVNLELIREALAQDGMEILTAEDPLVGLELFTSARPAVVLLDVVMPGLSGPELLQRMVEIDPGCEIMMMTAHYTAEAAVEAVQNGAADFLPKPLDLLKLRDRFALLLAEARRRQRAAQLDLEALETFQFEGIVGRSPGMLDLFAKIRRIAPHFRSVLVTGATGTGKELVAGSLHRLSPTAGKPLAVCNCAAVAESLFESELFGYVRGAFTGAIQNKVGLFEFANGGTVFLDEIGEMPLTAQAKLLRVLQNQEIQPVGSPAVRQINVRVIAATNRNLRTLVQENKFREDLYYRLSMVELEVPVLSERKEDLPLLQRHFLQKYSAQYGKEIRGITRRAQTILARYSWPGNIRELENVLGNACMMVEGTVIDVQDLPERLRSGSTAPVQTAGDELLTLEQVQLNHLQRVLAHVGGDKNQAAQVLGVSRSTIYSMLAKAGAASQAAGE